VGGVHLEDATLFTMHDLVHDLARLVMFDEINGGSCSRYALLNDCSKPLESPKIRALHFMDCGEIELDGAAFSSAKSLRVLDLNECSIHKLPDTIGVLKQLRYLNAPKIQAPVIPDSITRLSKLTYLNLHGSSAISALPESIGDFEGLLYIDLSGCSGIEKLPESFGRLTKLVHLDLSNCSRVGDVSKFLGSLRELQYLNLSHCPNIGELPKELCGLSELKYLNVSFSSYLESPKAEGFGALTNLEFSQEAEVLGANLEYLNLSCECSSIEKLPEALGTFVKLKYLNLSGFQHLRGLQRLFVNLKNLVHLDLSNCLRVNDVKSLGGLTKLEYLNLSIPRQGIFMSRELRGLPEVIWNLTSLRYLNLSSCMYSIFCLSEGQVDGFMCGISSLSNLEHLDLSSNRNIVRIPQSLCNLRKLHTLDLSDCRKLRKIPESIGTIDSLKFLYLAGCPYLSRPPQLNSSAVSFPHFAVHPGDGESSSSLLRLQHSNPDVLEITSLENVKSPEEAQRIELMKNHRLWKLKLQWTRDAERLVDDKMLLEKLVPPSSLKQLGIQGYTSGSFPAWLLDYRPNLVRIELCNLPSCNVLPPLSQLPNLNWLVLRGLESLEEWNTPYSSGQEHAMRNLEIHDCPKLSIKPLMPRAEWLEISKSDTVLSSWGEYTGASSYPVETTLHIKHCEAPMHQ
jgi:Leucine-rich repeat (LRR) protein